MVYVQYLQKSALTGELTPACGDRSVVILDGRNNIETMKAQAVSHNGFRRPIYLAYQIFRGDTFSRSEPITNIIEL